jgi:hypothetical protein
MRRRQHRRVVLVCFLLLMSPLLEPSYSFSAAKLPRRGLDRHKEQHFLNVVHFSSSLASRRRPFLSRLAETKTNNDGSEETKQPKISDKTLGILVLLTVPLSWGTYTPVVKYLYEIQPPVPGFVFSASYYMLAAVTTTVLALLSREPKDAKNAMNDNSQTSYWPIQGGLELGSYLFVANCLQVVGLQTVPSDRAGFLVQLTTVMVPFVEAVLAGNLLAVPIKTWYACILAFLGLFVMGLDGKAMLLDNPMATFATTFSSFTHGDLLTCSTGDLLIVGAAGFYSLHVVRLGGFARETTPIRLAATKATTEAIFSVGLVGFLMFLASSISASDGLMGFAVSTGSEISSFFSTFFAGVVSGIVPKSALFSALGATLWTGWITCAYTIYAQSFGQSRVR